jgi:hypothetical protein
MFDIKKFNDLQIETDKGFVDFDGIAKLPSQNLIKFIFDDDTYIEVTYRHQFVVDDLIIEACDLNVGEVLQTKNEEFKTIKHIELVDSKEVYEVLEVKDIHRYFVNGILSHNCKFIGTSNTLVDGDVLDRINVIEPISTKWGGLLNVYKYPEPRTLYILGVDSAEGVGKDFSAIQVLKFTSERDVEQVAIYKNNSIEVSKFAQICISVSEYYNNAYMMVENNAVGALVAKYIWEDYEYDKILNCDRKGLGIKSTKRTKSEGNMLLKKYMENGWLTLCDKSTLYELSLYEEIKLGVFEAQEGAHDDCVTSLIWALYFVVTEFFDGKNLEIQRVDSEYKIEGSWDDDSPIIYTEIDCENIDFDDVDDIENLKDELTYDDEDEEYYKI